ncbi:unnamed protein product [Dicrocoelium dendriticum]|nr:unnamed protein product [Dicrocoelium dendriticum]
MWNAMELNLLRKQLTRGAEAKRIEKDGSGPAVSEEHGNRRSIIVDHGLPLTKTHSTQTDHVDWAPEAQFGANLLESNENFLTPVNGPKTDSNQVIQPILQQLRLLQSDKEYLTKQVSNLTQKLAAVDKREQLRLNVLETRRAGDCEQADSSGNEDQRTGDCQSQLKGTFSQPVELTKEETLSTQIKSLQKQRDEALTQLTGMRLELKQTQHELESRTEMLQLLTNAVDPEVQRAGTSGELLNDLAAHKEFSKSAVDLEAAQAARKEALLLVDKLTAQLEASRTAYHELKLQSSKECTLLECKLREAENKLSAYEELENQLNEAIDSVGDTQPESPSVIHDLFPHIEHYFFLSKRDKKCEAATRHGTLVLPTLAARRMEHAMKLTKQLRELESKYTGSLKELREKKAELEVAKEQISTLSNLIALSGQPRDYLVATLARRECQMRQLRKKLSGTEHRLLMLNQTHQCVTEERDALATDLKRLLRSRRNVVHLTEQVAQLLRSSDVSNRLYNLHRFDEHTYIGRMPSEQVVGPRTCRKRILPPYDIDRS